jgi:hypothetical protein
MAKIAFVIAVSAGALLLLLFALQVDPTGAQSGPDLTAEISIDPPLPDVGQEVTITVAIHNQGDQNAGSFCSYLYVDPADRPPTPSTPGYPSCISTLPLGTYYSFSRKHTFTTADCDHVVYAWVDRDNTVSEVSESNNLVSETICVGVQCTEDIYEDNDTCDAARWIAEGVTQTHSLCPVGDQDWVKFTAIGGVTYTVEATTCAYIFFKIVSRESKTFLSSDISFFGEYLM